MHKIRARLVFAPVNNFIHSLFFQVELFFNGQSFENSNIVYPYKAYLTDLLNYGQDSKNSYLQSQLFYKDDATQMDNLKVLLTDAERKGETVAQIKNGLLHRKSILKQKSEFCLNGNELGNYSVSVESAILLVRKAQINSSVMLGHTMALEKTTAKYPIKRVVVKQHTIGLGVSSKVISNISHSSLPSRVVIGMVTNSAYDGNYTLNPFNFRHFNLSKQNLMFDGQSAPYYKPLQFNFAVNQYIKGYYSLFENNDKPDYATGNDISRLDYPNRWLWQNKMVYKPQHKLFQTNVNIPRQNKNKIKNPQTQNSENTSLFKNNSNLNTNRETIKNRMGYGPVQNRIFSNHHRSSFVFSNKPSISSNGGLKQQLQHQHQHNNNPYNNHQIRHPRQQNQQQNFRWQPRNSSVPKQHKFEKRKIIRELNAKALDGSFDGKSFTIQCKDGESKTKLYSPVCKICVPNPTTEKPVYTTIQTFGKNGNLIKHLRSHKHEIGIWLGEFDKYSATKIHSKKLDPKMYHLVKFFIRNALAVKALEDKDLRQVFPKLIGKYSFVEILINAEYVVLIVDAWSSKCKKEFVVVSAATIKKDLNRDVFILGLERLIGRHNAENLKKCIESIVNRFEFNKKNVVLETSQIAEENVDEDADVNEEDEIFEDEENNSEENASDDDNLDGNEDNEIIEYQFAEKLETESKSLSENMRVEPYENVTYETEYVRF
ncbi:unnamed protein product [Brachionus calyciflorus]|uniref:Uncharacterized protein n=1 Tax=Brachionus calyciflorus TaxID=104777 RepID=A0A814EZ40_9BILA|nr:unnamed protein product [Brachionus calyciflorus]